jgi:uroporphyrinogen decarboxylase
MTGRERVLTALNHKEPDRIPLDIGGANACGIMLPAYRNLVKYAGLDVKPRVREFSDQLAWMDEETCRFLNIDTRRLILPADDFWKKVREEPDYYWYVDEWNRTLRMPKEKGHYFDFVGFPLKDTPLENYRWPFPYAAENLDRLAVLAERYASEAQAALCMPTIGNGFLQLGAQLFGYDDWFAMLMLEPERVEKFLDKLLELKTAYWEGVLGRLGDYIDVVCETDDLGTQKGPWVNPELWRLLMKPRLAELVKRIKKIRPGMKVSLHACGSVYDFIPDLIEIGIDILNPIQVSAAKMDTKQLKREFGKDLVFWGGGVDTQWVLPRGTVKEVKDEVKRRIDDLAPGGGFVFATVHNIQSDVPPENIMAMIEALREA